MKPRVQRPASKRALPDYEYRELRDKLVAEWMEEDMMDPIFVIVQAWTPSGSEYELTEIAGSTGPEFYETVSDARDALRAIAGEYDVEVGEDDSIAEILGSRHESEYYYIETIWKAR